MLKMAFLWIVLMSYQGQAQCDQLGNELHCDTLSISQSNTTQGARLSVEFSDGMTIELQAQVDQGQTHASMALNPGQRKNLALSSQDKAQIREAINHIEDQQQLEEFSLVPLIDVLPNGNSLGHDIAFSGEVQWPNGKKNDDDDCRLEDKKSIHCK